MGEVEGCLWWLVVGEADGGGASCSSELIFAHPHAGALDMSKLTDSGKLLLLGDAENLLFVVHSRVRREPLHMYLTPPPALHTPSTILSP